MADISEARNALGYMSAVLTSFQNADKVLAALENAEQVGKELTLANDAIRAQVNDAQASYADVVARADALVEDATAKAAALVADANAKSDDIINAAQLTQKAAIAGKEAAEAARDQAVAEQQDAEAARDKAWVEHDDAVAKLAAAKDKLSALLA